MAVPYRRTSASKARMRRAHDGLRARAYTDCSHCGEPVVPHRVCRACGFYKGVQVLGISAEADTQEQVATDS